MPTIDSILGQIATEAADGQRLGSIDRCTTSELIEAREEFPDQFPGRAKFVKIGELNLDMLQKYIPNEVHNRAQRLNYLDQTNPLLKYYFIPEECHNEAGEFIAEKLTALLDDLVSIYWAWENGDWHDKSEEIVMTTVWENYLSALSKFAPSSFLRRETVMHM